MQPKKTGRASCGLVVRTGCRRCVDVVRRTTLRCIPAPSLPAQRASGGCSLGPNAVAVNDSRFFARTSRPVTPPPRCDAWCGNQLRRRVCGSAASRLCKPRHLLSSLRSHPCAPASAFVSVEKGADGLATLTLCRRGGAALLAARAGSHPSNRADSPSRTCAQGARQLHEPGRLGAARWCVPCRPLQLSFAALASGQPPDRACVGRSRAGRAGEGPLGARRRDLLRPEERHLHRGVRHPSRARQAVAAATNGD